MQRALDAKAGLILLRDAPRDPFSSCSSLPDLFCSDRSSPGELPAHAGPEWIEILVDGSGDGHSIALFPGEEVYFSYERGASNNEAEFNAVILALENLPPHSSAHISTDSQVVVWHLCGEDQSHRPTFMKKRIQIQDIILEKKLRITIRWIPRRQNHADRFLRNYVASLCGAGGTEPLHRRVRRLENENLRLKAQLKRAMKLLERRGAPLPNQPELLEMFG